MNRASIEHQEKTALDDDDLRELICEGVEADPVFHVGRDSRTCIEVEVDDGEVTLHGLVRTALDRRKADILARALGAKTVDNRIQVQPGTSERGIVRAGPRHARAIGRERTK